MRRSRIAYAALVMCLGTGGLAQAGVYSTAEPQIWPMPSEFKQFKQDSLVNFRALRVPEEEKRGHFYPRFKKHMDLLEEKKRAGTLNAEDRINLSYYYIYFGKPAEAADLLETIPGDQRNYMVLANLATAHHLADRLDRAVSYQEQVLKSWPAAVPGWKPEQWALLARAEKCYLRLLRSRYLESQRNPGKFAWETLDPVFPGLRFEGPSGRYEAGRLATEHWTEVPPDAIPLMGQLVLWLPYDDRIYWLLGELLNAKGDVLGAEEILNELVYSRNITGIKELRDHRKVLMQAKETLKANSEMELDSSPTSQPTSSAAPPESWLPSWRDVAVGFGAGVVVVLLVQMQWRESRRRRQGLAPAPRG